VPAWVSWLVAGVAFALSCVGLALAILFAGALEIAVAIAAAIVALIALVILAL
jgi:hypothetical protein